MAHLFPVSLRLDVSPSWRFPLPPCLKKCNTVSHKQIIARCVGTPWPRSLLLSTGSSSALCSAETPPPRPCQVWQIGVSRQQGQGGGCHFGSMDTPAHPPVGGETRRAERERAGAHPGRLTTRLWMSGWVWTLLQTDVTEADRPQTGGMWRWKHFSSCCQTNKRLKYPESVVAATPFGNNKILQQNKISTSQKVMRRSSN